MRRLMIIMLCLPFVFITHAQTDSPPPRPIITPENAHQLTQIAQLGRGRILDVAFSEDESTLLVASTIGIWAYDMTDLSAEPMLIAPQKLPNGQFSPNGQLFISIENNRMFVWHIAQNHIIAQADVSFTHQRKYAVSPNSGQVAILLDNAMYVLDILTGDMRLVISLDDHFNDILHLIWHPDNTKIAVHNSVPDEQEDWKRDEEFWIWDVITGGVIEHTVFPRFNMLLPQIDAIQFSPDGEVLAMGDRNRLLLWSLKGQVRRIEVFKYHANTNEVLFSPDGRIIATAGGQNINGYSGDINTAIHIWDVELGESLALMGGHDARVTKMIFTHDSRYLVSMDAYHVIRLWDVAIGAEIGRIVDHNQGSILRGNAQGTAYVSSSSNNGLYVWDMNTFTPRFIPNLTDMSAQSYIDGFSPDGRTLIVYSRLNEKILAIDTGTWQVRHTLNAMALRSIAYHPTLPIIGLTNKWYSANFWNYETGEGGLGMISNANFYTFEFLPEHNQIIYNDTHWGDLVRSNRLVVMDIETGETLDILRHPSSVPWMAVSPDNRILITYGNDLWLWDTSTWAIRDTLQANFRAFTPDSQFIIATINDRIQFIDSQTLMLHHEIQLPFIIESDSQIQFSPAYDWLLYMTNDGEYVLIDTQIGKILKSFSVTDFIQCRQGDILPLVKISPDGRFIFIVGEVTQILGIPTENVP